MNNQSGSIDLMGRAIFKRLVVLAVILIFVTYVVIIRPKMDKNNIEMSLIVSAVHGDFDMVKEYSKRVDSLNYGSMKGDTPLNAAVNGGDIKIVMFLVEQGASVEYKDIYDRTSIQLSKELGHTEITEYLESVKASSNSLD